MQGEGRPLRRSPHWAFMNGLTGQTYMWFCSAAGRSEARNADARGLLLMGRHGDLGIVHSGRSLLPGPPG